MGLVEPGASPGKRARRKKVAIAVGALAVLAGGGLLLGESLFGSHRSLLEGRVGLPGDASLDLAKLQEQTTLAEAAVKALQSAAGAETSDPEILKGYLPESVSGGFGRVGTSTGHDEVAGVEGSGAQGSYEKGASRIKVRVVDVGSSGALAGLVTAFNVRSSTGAADHYEKVSEVDGRLTQESYDWPRHAGSYSVMVGQKFVVQASGENVSMDELKAAVRAVDVAGLETLVRTN